MSHSNKQWQVPHSKRTQTTTQPHSVAEKWAMSFLSSSCLSYTSTYCIPYEDRLETNFLQLHMSVSSASFNILPCFCVTVPPTCCSHLDLSLLLYFPFSFISVSS